MTRKTKAKHTEQLITAAQQGYTTERFYSPKLAIAAKADRGHYLMTGREYAEHRMHRGQMPTCRGELKIETAQKIHRQQRVIGGRRVTGLAPGTKTPIIQMAPASRKITRK